MLIVQSNLQLSHMLIFSKLTLTNMLYIDIKISERQRITFSPISHTYIYLIFQVLHSQFLAQLCYIY